VKKTDRGQDSRAAREKSAFPPRTREPNEKTHASPAASPDTAPTAPPGSPAARPEPAREPKPGDRIGHRYELIKLIGRGGMGSVFKARDVTLPRHVAIKFLNAASPELSSRLVQEAQATANIQQENIVTIHEVGHHLGQPFIVFEYLEGSSLKEILADGTPMPASRAVELVAPVVRALAAAHEKGIVHRDLKPDNIMVTKNGVVKVLDFGVAKLLPNSRARGLGPEVPDASSADLERPAEAGAADGPLTRAGMLIGTLPWMAPEQFGADSVDPRTDLFALGLVLFRMLAGKHPLHGLKGIQFAVMGDLERPMPRLSAAAPAVSPELALVVDRCLSKRKDDRFSDALALLRALEPFFPGRARRDPGQVDQSPYPGLSSFQEADADRFFGRAREAAALANRVRDQPLTVVAGASGVGKTSLTRAALAPALKRSGEGWEVLLVRPGRAPLGALANAIAPFAGISKKATVTEDLLELDKLVEALRADPGLAGRTLRAAAGRERRRILLCVDPFEELYTLCRDSERLAFTSCLAGVADDSSSPLRLLLTLRSDYLHRLGEEERFAADLGPALFFLAPPNREGLREAIEEPANLAGYRFEPGVVEDMLEQVQSTPGALPLLQFVASHLWESRDPARKLLTQASYQALGGTEGALARHADHVLRGLPAGQQSAARALFLRLVTPDRTRAIVSLDELKALAEASAEIEQLLEQLVRARLLVVEKSERGNSVEIVHESLIHRWPTLSRWLDEAGEDVGFLEQLRASSQLWAAAGRDDDLLWRGERVEDARRFQRRFRGELSRLEQEYLGQVFAREAKAARRNRALAISGVAFLGLLVLASVVALVVIQSARAEAVRQARAASDAEAQARERLVQVERKERERAEAETRARERLVEVERKERERAEAAKRAEEWSAALALKNQELLAALKRAETLRRRADANSLEARRAREQALSAASEIEKLLKVERERVRRLQEQFGSPVVETVKWQAGVE
jgi:serine/threonine protein kinase